MAHKTADSTNYKNGMPWPDMAGMNAVLSLESSIMWVGTMLLIPEFLHN